MIEMRLKGPKHELELYLASIPKEIIVGGPQNVRWYKCREGAECKRLYFDVDMNKHPSLAPFVKQVVAHPYPKTSYGLPHGGHVTVDRGTPPERAAEIVQIVGKLQEGYLALTPEQREQMHDDYTKKQLLATPEHERINANSTVFHIPSRETWHVLGANYQKGEICVAGWPATRANIADCRLVQRGTEPLSDEELKYRNATFGADWQ